MMTIDSDVGASDLIRAREYVCRLGINQAMSHVYTVSSGEVTLDDLIARKARILAPYPNAIDIDICSNEISRFDDEDHQAMLQLALRAFRFLRGPIGS